MNKAKKTLSLLLAVSMIVGLFCMIPANADSTEQDVVTIFHTNDMHATVENLSYVSTLRGVVPNSLLVDAGDAVQGSALATYTKGSAIVKLMNEAGYDLGTLGNHEFDYGAEALLANAEAAEFPLISANTLDKDGKLLLDGVNESNGKTWTTEVNGHKIGFFGLTTTETAFKTNPQNLNGITFEDEVETAEAMVAELEAEDCDVIVALAHVGIDLASDPTSHKIAEEVDGIDILIDGHSHSEEVTVVNDTHIAQTGTKLAHLGEIKITFAEDDTFEVDSRLVTEEEYKDVVSPDENYEKLYAELNEELAPILEKEVAFSNTHIYYSAADSMRTTRIEQTPCSTLVAESMKWTGEQMLKALDLEYPVVALQNGGGVRADLPKGVITQGDILNVLPYSNTIQIIEITPDKLYAAIENGVASLGLTKDGYLDLETLAGAYPQVAGMHIVVDTAAEAGKRVTEVYLLNENNERTLLKADDKETKLALVSNDFELAGGDGYTVLGECEKITEGGPLDTALLEYVEHISVDGKFTWAKADTRIFIKGVMEKQNKDFCDITLDVKLEANKLYDVELDGEKTFKAMSDAEGYITIYSVAPGYHTVYLPALEGTKVEKVETDEEGNETKIEVEVNPYLYVSTFTNIGVKGFALKDKLVNGDMNNDGTLTMLDVVKIQRFIAELYENGMAIQHADFNGDSEINLKDVTSIQRKIAGLAD